MKKILSPFTSRKASFKYGHSEVVEAGGTLLTTRSRKRDFSNFNLPALLLLLAVWLGSGIVSAAFAQVTTLTTETGTGFDGGNGLTGNSFITFVVENTNPYPITLTEVDDYLQTASNGTIPTLWYTSTAISGPITGATAIASPTWTSIVTGPAVTVTADGYVPVLTNLSFNIPAGAQYRFALQSTINIRYSGSGAGTPSPNIFTGGGVNLKIHDNSVAGAVVGFSGAFPTGSNSPRAFTGRIKFQPAAPCTAPPTAGTTVSSVASVCPNTNFVLSLTGASGGTGQTYQWQSSATGVSGSFTNITGATSPTLTTTQTATRFYQAVLTCSGQTANSVPVQVTTSAIPTSGTFTINKNVPASSTNFQSISAAIASIQCGGVNGPIVFNIVSGSSATTPYSEQVVIPTIPGASATNTITINGNGNTVVGTSTSGDAFKLDGAKFIRVNNLTIKTEPTATAGAVVSLVNGATDNIFNNNTLTHTGSLTSASTSYGLYVYTGSNNNTFSNNTINGGYYGIYHYNGAATAATALTANSFTGNTVNDFYYYGIYNYYTNNTLIEGNNFSRPTRTNHSTSYVIYLSTGNTNAVVSKNRIHNLYDMATSLTGSAYGIYTSSAAAVGSENIIKNNVLYNFNNNAGIVYGLYNTGGNGTYYYYNTVAFDNPSFTGSTLRGMYFLSASTNVKFQNNIVSIKAPAGTRHAIYLGSSTITLISNNNDLYAPGGNVGYYSGDKTTIADWKAANSNAYDQNSVSSDPIFVNSLTGDLHPSSGAVNNIGVPIAGITDDITGAVRNATTPDPGAYEFTPAANDVGVSVIISPNTGCGLSNVETVSVTLNNYGTAAQSNIPVSYTINGGTAVSQTFAGPLAPGTSATFTFTTKANLATAGTYTIVASTGLNGDAIAVNDATTKVVNSIPSVATFPYFENFENGAGGWTTSGSASSWALGTPAKATINSAGSGTKSWVTGLTGTYNASENSQVLGPCFNLSTLTAPIIEMKIWWASEASYDGAVLQSSINGGTTWQNVGALNDPINWYNESSLDGRAGGQDIGWAGNGTASSGGWVNAKHALTGLGGQSSVLLRIAFGSDPSVQYDGFAFDDISIYQTPSNDVELVAITAPISSGCGFSAAETVTVTIKNNGTVPTPVPFQVKYQIGTNPAVIENVTTAIAPGATLPFSFTGKANFSAVGTYNLTATTMLTGDGLPANDSKTKVITVVPTISTLPYSEGFENGAGGWVAGGTNSSWALGTPAKPVINSAAGGTKAWITGLTAQYNASENSFVQGPCFNFTGIADPDFEMKAWWNSEFSWDGAVLQSSIDGGTTWQNVGAFGDPNNWYTDNTINGAPGGQPAATAQGWSGRASTNNGSNGWVKVKHKLTGLGNKSSVLLRIAFGSDGSGQDDGFAFDDIRIGDNTGNLAINSFVPLTKICGYGSNEKVEVVLENLGSVAATGFQVSYTVDGGPAVTQTYTGSLAPGTANYIFPVGANLSAPGAHTIVVTVTGAGDPDATNNTVTYTVTNALFPGLPIKLDFETPTTGIGAMRLVVMPKATITENTAASNPHAATPTQPAIASTKGMIMDGIDNAAWTLPAGLIDPWTVNPDNFAAAYICFSPAGGASTDSLWLTFDLKQLFKTANANTNFRVTVNGTQVGPTYRPPFAGGTPVWQKVKIDLTSYKNQSNIQIGLESSVKEAYAAGAGTANLLDNIWIVRRIVNGVKDDILSSGVQVYPNPSTGIFNVSLPSTGKNFSLEVTDLTGKVIKQQTASSKDKTAQLKLNTFAQGVYLLKVTSDEASTVRRIVIQ